MEAEKNTTAMKALVVLVVIGVIVGGAVMLTGGDDNTTNDNSTNTSQASESTMPTDTSPTTQTSALQPDSVSATPATAYKDGTYSVTTSYTAPPGREDIGVTITLADSKITNVSIENKADHPTSIRYQDDFAAAIASLVSGVSIDNAEVDEVSGSSLTSNGFNDALEEIREQAS